MINFVLLMQTVLETILFIVICTGLAAIAWMSGRLAADVAYNWLRLKVGSVVDTLLGVCIVIAWLGCYVCLLISCSIDAIHYLKLHNYVGFSVNASVVFLFCFPIGVACVR